MPETLQQRIERTASKLAALKAQATAKEAREQARRKKESRAYRNRGLVLFGIVLEAECRVDEGAPGAMRELIERHLTRATERAAALEFLSSITSQAAR